ncbi:hypothetical protein PFISCL1PPCAC_3615 [Pristionchus fissidentatus]|uniref:F-box domain-containing protein n=1 Tax=Pristionchus fissidentatus TaxID=1538716 RepID=A0AAV5UZW4_9BILA|nr:hypothetical protein PFISCL1PPCAC_3615 [Pristionchus fissidentatus]
MIFADELQMDSPSLTLEKLPKENVHKIFSNLGLQDRKTVRKCSQTLKEAVQGSDLYVDGISLEFDEKCSNDLELVVCPLSGGKGLRTTVNSNYSELIKRWLKELSERLFFRRLIAGQLMIQCNAELVQESILGHVAAHFDYQELSLVFNSRNQQSVLHFALQSKKHIDCFKADFYVNLDPLEILALPQMNFLSVLSMNPGFSDEQALTIARKEHTTAQIVANFSHTTTLRSLIQMVHSSRVAKEMAIIMPTTYFRRFLDSIGLREEGRGLLDVSYPNSSPVYLLEAGYVRNEYYLRTGAGYLNTHGLDTHGKHAFQMLRIANGPYRNMPVGCMFSTRPECTVVNSPITRTHSSFNYPLSMTSKCAEHFSSSSRDSSTFLGQL